MLKTKSEQKAWIVEHWSGLVRQGKLAEALRRYWGLDKNINAPAIEVAKEIFVISDKP